MEKKCTCKVKKGGWFFDFSTDPEKNEWQRDDALGKAVEKWIDKQFKTAKEKLGKKAVKSKFEMLLNMERQDKKFQDEFLISLTKCAKRHVQGWQFRFGMTLIDSTCPLHGSKEGQ